MGPGGITVGAGGSTNGVTQSYIQGLDHIYIYHCLHLLQVNLMPKLFETQSDEVPFLTMVER